MEHSKAVQALDVLEKQLITDQADKATACDENIQVLQLAKLARMILQKRDAKPGKPE